MLEKISQYPFASVDHLRRVRIPYLPSVQHPSPEVHNIDGPLLSCSNKLKHQKHVQYHAN